MRQLALLLSTLALATSIGTLIMLRRARPAAPVEVPRSPRAPAPAQQPLTGECTEIEGVTTLKGIMRRGVNVQLTRISFALYHDKRDSDARMAAAATAAAALRTCINRATALAPELPVSDLAEYFRMLNGLEENALAVQIATLEKDEAAARHWYLHIKQDCASCHNRFRTNVDEEEAR
jgi:hypothetical protein